VTVLAVVLAAAGITAAACVFSDTARYVALFAATCLTLWAAVTGAAIAAWFAITFLIGVTE
jgi:hypothetical protein